MMEMAAHSDGRTATTFMSDMKAEGPQEEADLYSSMMEMDLPLFPMGKVYTAKRGTAKNQIIHLPNVFSGLKFHGDNVYRQTSHRGIHAFFMLI